MSDPSRFTSDMSSMPFPPTAPRLSPVTTKPESPPAPRRPRKSLPGIGPPASPWIRRRARLLGIDLGQVHGTARGGRIVRGDLEDYIEGKAS